MQKIILAAIALTACGYVVTANAQSSAGEGVIVDVESCIDLETREQQLDCYEEQVNEVLRARDAEADAGDTQATPADVVPVTPEPSRQSRRAERREARAAERRERELQRAAERREREIQQAAARAAEAAEAAEAAATAAAAAEAALAAAAAAEAAEAAAAAAEDPDYVAGEIVGTLVAVEEIQPDSYRITLDNGQVWQQRGSKRYLLQVGAEVRLRPSRWGPSYRLTDPNVGNFIQVQRLN